MGKRLFGACGVAAVVGAVVLHAHVAWSQDEADGGVGEAGAGRVEAGGEAGAGGETGGGETRSGTGTGTGTTSGGTTATGCGAGMVEVEGEYCAELPEQRCLKWVSTTGKGRCAEFAPSEACASPTVRKHFCIDRFEYPNLPGENPLVMKNWFEARALCTSNGKRLCNDSEWTLACEGPERLPYPYGLSRDATACNIDKPPINVKEDELRSVQRRDAEAKRLWQGEASGARDRCKSSFGVQDMTGNVDEWVVNETGKPHRSALKGGYWSWVRGRCRPTTDGHAEDFRYYQIGFRCCSDASATPSAASTSAAR